MRDEEFNQMASSFETPRWTRQTYIRWKPVFTDLPLDFLGSHPKGPGVITKINAKNPELRRSWTELQPWYKFFSALLWAVEHWKDVDRQNNFDLAEISSSGYKPPKFSPRVNQGMRLGMCVGKILDWVKDPYWP
jgi:hypothetical protein